jgi:hypothetical protein
MSNQDYYQTHDGSYPPHEGGYPPQAPPPNDQYGAPPPQHEQHGGGPYVQQVRVSLFSIATEIVRQSDILSRPRTLFPCFSLGHTSHTDWPLNSRHTRRHPILMINLLTTPPHPQARAGIHTKQAGTAIHLNTNTPMGHLPDQVLMQILGIRVNLEGKEARGDWALLWSALQA